VNEMDGPIEIEPREAGWQVEAPLGKVVVT
jgi:hypothetical protein